MDGYRRTFDLLRYQRERFDLPVCTAGRVAGGSRELEGSRVREGWRLSSTGICVDATDALGRRLLPDELRKGDRVAVGGVNSPAWLLADLAVQQAGGARLEPRPVRLFSTAGMAVVEGYGLTEGSTFVTADGRPGDSRRPGTVGRPIPGVEVRVADDGEVLVHGPNAMRGYLDRPDLTREAIDADGWFHTGDLRDLDEDGFLRITGRKKDLFKLSGGEYVAPEARHLIADDLDLPGEGLPHAERVERFEILPEEWSVEGGELSPTLKIKRHVVTERHGDVVERSYRDYSPSVAG